MGGNAYARPYRAQPFVQPDLAPVYAGGSKNFNEMQDVSGPDLAPAVMPSDSWSRRRINFDPTEPVQATQAVMPEPNYGGGLGSLMSGMNGSVPYPSSPSFSGFGPLQQNPQLLAQMQGAEFENQRKAADLQRLRSQPYDPRQLIG
jgi:hypothetical protein